MNISDLAAKIDEVRTALNSLTPEDIKAKSAQEIRALYDLAHHIRTMRMDVMLDLTDAYMRVVHSEHEFSIEDGPVNIAA